MKIQAPWWYCKLRSYNCVEDDGTEEGAKQQGDDESCFEMIET
jgi:hypothetical protein